jgi:hypothetical protein
MEAILAEPLRQRLRSAALASAAGHTWAQSARIAAGIYRDFVTSRRR